MCASDGLERVERERKINGFLSSVNIGTSALKRDLLNPERSHVRASIGFLLKYF